MHACGHDAHSAILLGTTLALYRARPLPVAWRSIFQPSEEAGRGACEMVKQGALEGVDAIIALHVDPNLPVGKVAITPGPRTAFCQDFTIEIAGRGGHGARPHTTVDPIATAAHLITLTLSGGSAANRRASTGRGHDRRYQCRIRIERHSGHGVAPRHDSNIEHRGGNVMHVKLLNAFALRSPRHLARRFPPVFERLLPGMVNDTQIATLAADVAGRLLGPENILRNEPPSMGAEDFADYLPVVPGCMIGLGAKGADRKITPLHTATFDIDETALLIGARLFAAFSSNGQRNRYTSRMSPGQSNLQT